jgi:hypothetical protein
MNRRVVEVEAVFDNDCLVLFHPTWSPESCFQTDISFLYAALSAMHETMPAISN